MMENLVSVTQIHSEGFTLLGREYSSNAGAALDFGYIWGNFFETGGYEKILPHQKNKDEHCVDTLVFYTKSPDCKTVYIGHIVDGITDMPEGHVLEKFPASEFVVVSSNWQPTEGESHDVANAGKDNLKIPDGYMEDRASPYVQVEKIYHCPEKGHKLERWYPIKKK
ncbi:MAG: GyrI-like domain-containing protein [Oscillospiraceae bacterium]|nr:GyrI-like domain-containing protein [Oscillospiraceae bacterium]